MNEIEKKALALVNEIRVNQGYPPNNLFIRTLGPTTQALCRAIEQHETYKQDVSDAVESYLSGKRSSCILDHFIIPKPTVDPLTAVLAECDWFNSPTLAADIHEGLAKRGLKIVETFTRPDNV